MEKDVKEKHLFVIWEYIGVEGFEYYKKTQKFQGKSGKIFINQQQQNHCKTFLTKV